MKQVSIQKFLAKETDIKSYLQSANKIFEIITSWDAAVDKMASERGIPLDDYETKEMIKKALIKSTEYWIKYYKHELKLLESVKV